MPPPSEHVGAARLSVPFAPRAVGGRGFWRKLARFAGPGYLVAVGYMDPGNWATDLTAGSRFGYSLLWVVAASSLVAMFLQTLALRLGVATGRDLARTCREHFGQSVALSLWLVSELGIIACDLAEVVGSAVALNLLFGLPLLVGVCLTALDVLLVLHLQGRGFRTIEAIVVALVVTIAACCTVELSLAQPDLRDAVAGLWPSGRTLGQPGALYVAVGILGATVMPHTLFLHSAATRRYAVDAPGRFEAMRFGTMDALIALSAALLVNGMLLVLAAAAFFATGHTDVVEIQDAYRLLAPVLGPAFAAPVFGVALLAAGQASSLTGTMAGQIVMEGFLGWRVSPSRRRFVTRLLAIAPAIGAIAIAGESSATQLLILSQVILSFQLGFAVIPLVRFTNDRAIMGHFVSPPAVRALAWAATAAIVGLNAWLVCQWFA
jgi:manganese transport protein